jgi:hypothetical protein
MVLSKGGYCVARRNLGPDLPANLCMRRCVTAGIKYLGKLKCFVEAEMGSAQKPGYGYLMARIGVRKLRVPSTMPTNRWRQGALWGRRRTVWPDPAKTPGDCSISCASALIQRWDKVDLQVTSASDPGPTRDLLCEDDLGLVAGRGSTAVAQGIN